MSQATRQFARVGNKMILLFFILSLFLSSPVLAARLHPVPEICGNFLDDDGDGLVDNNCPMSDAFSAITGGQKADVKDCQLITYTTDTDTLSLSGTYVKKPAGTPYYTGQIACQVTATGTFYMWVRYRTSSHRAMWVGTSPLALYPNNSTQATFVPNSAIFQWAEVGTAGSGANFRAQVNGTGQRTLSLSGTQKIYLKAVADIDFDRLCISTSAARPDACDGSAPQADYTALELGAASAPTAWNHASFDNANVLQFSGYDDTGGLTCTVKMIWDNAVTDKGYLSVNCLDTDNQNSASLTANDDADFPTLYTYDGISMAWRGDLTQSFDTDMQRLIVELGNGYYYDADYSGASNTLNSAVNLNTSCTTNVVASTSWNIFCSFDLGSDITPDDIGLMQFAIQDKDASVGAKYLYAFGTTIDAINFANQYGTVKFSSSTLPGGPDTTEPTVTNLAFVNVRSTSFVATFDTNEIGTPSVVYGTTDGGPYPDTVQEQQPCVSSCAIAVTGLTPGTTYYLKAQVTDAANNTGQSSQGSQATNAATADWYVSPTGTGTTCSSGSPCSIATVWTKVTGAARRVQLKNGTYQGADYMIQPPSGLNGSAANPIVLSAETDGSVTIDGQGQQNRNPVRLDNNDYFILEGFDATNSCAACAVILLKNGSDNNIVRRVIAWNPIDGVDRNVWSVNYSSNNLLEDVAGFGTGRYIFGPNQGREQNQNNVIRRAWGAWQRHDNVLISGPKSTFILAYRAYNQICENCIGTWNTQQTGIFEPYSIFRVRGDGPTATPNQDFNPKYLGSIAYMRTAGGYAVYGLNVSNMNAPAGSTSLLYDNVFAYSENGRSPWRTYPGPCTVGGNCIIQNSTGVSSASSLIEGNYNIATNNKAYTSMALATADGANPFQTTTGNGARICYKYKNGVLTTEPLFDSNWQSFFITRLNAAIVASGQTVASFFGTSTDLMDWLEDNIGTIPAGCKS